MASPDFGEGNASTRLHAGGGLTRFEQLQVDLLAVSARGDVQLPSRGLPRGRLSVTAETLQPIGRLMGLELDGRANAEAEVRRSVGSIQVATSSS